MLEGHAVFMHILTQQFTCVYIHIHIKEPQIVQW